VKKVQVVRHVSVLDMRYWSDSQRIHVWPEIFWMDNRTFGRVKRKLRDSPVERAGEVSGVGLWGLDDEKVVIRAEEEG
jgi:hypothetical protein